MLHKGVADLAAGADVPMAFTNPIWVDANGDGRWDPPGLEPLPKLITEPTQAPST